MLGEQLFPYFTHHTFLGTTDDGGVYVTITWEWSNEQNELSLTGVIGPKANGDARGSCGQTGVPNNINFAPGWDAESAAKLDTIWNRWHLNGMRAGSPAQEAWLREHPVSVVYPESYSKVKDALIEAGLQPDESFLHNDEPYSYGSAWLHEDVPTDVLEWLKNLPDNAQRLPECWRH
jgi:hypothetical protein